MSAMTVFEAEAAAERVRSRRAGLVALADYITGPIGDLLAEHGIRADYPDPWDVFAAFCPGVDRRTVENEGAELLRLVVRRAAGDRVAHDIEVTLDYLTGVR